MNILLETERLILREWEQSDYETLLAIANQPYVNNWLPDWCGFERWGHDWIDRVKRHYLLNEPMQKFISWAMVVKSTNIVIGDVGIGAFEDKEIGIGYFIDENFCNQGYATEAVKILTQYVFKTFKYDHIIATVQPSNHATNAVAKKAGFRYLSTIERLDNGQTEVLPFHYYRLEKQCYKIISVRENPEYLDRAVDYFSSKWGIDRKVYDGSISHSINTDSALPRWYLMLKSDEIIGSYGLIVNDFISRQDLWPWLCALYVEESERGNALGSRLLIHGRSEAKKLGFDKLYLCTNHDGYYEKYGWAHLGQGFGPFGESKIYVIESEGKCNVNKERFYNQHPKSTTKMF